MAFTVERITYIRSREGTTSRSVTEQARGCIHPGMAEALKLLPAVMNSSGKIICEHPAEETLEKSVENFVIKKQYRYGKIMITVYSDKDVEGL